MNPIPPSPLFHGSTAARAKAVATTASTALPPALSTSAPTRAAVPLCDATTPPREAAGGLRMFQFCVRCIRGARSGNGDRIDPIRIEGVIAREPRYFVVGRGIGPYGVLRPPDRAGVRRNLDRPVRRLALVRAAGVLFRRTHQVEP